MGNILFIVDPQNDFIEGGNLPVTGAFDKMCALSGYLGRINYNKYDKIYVSLDWHPYSHCSFKENGGEWPVHCVEYTNGAQVFQPVMFNLLYWMKQDKVVFINKGCDKNVEEYSAVISKNDNKYWGDFLNADCIDVVGIVGTVCVQNTINGMLRFKKDHGAEFVINALTNYIPQFSEEDENNFINWCKENKVNVIFNV